MELYLFNNKCTVVIFDLDGTFYPRSFYQTQYTEFAITALKHYFQMDRQTAIKVLKNNNIISTKPDSARSFTEFIIEKGISSSDWNSFRDAHYNLTGFENTCVVKEKTLRVIGTGRLLYLVSNNSLKAITHILHEISIPRQLFSRIYSSEEMNQGNKKYLKKQIYQQIKTTLGCPYLDIVAIGDRFISDIKPLIDLGGNGILVESPMEIENITSLLSI